MKLVKSYVGLRAAVSETLFEGQRKIEKLKVETYWKTGKLIRSYLNKQPRIEAKEILSRLSEDLHLERTLFYRTLQFFDGFPSVATWRLKWSHYRELLTLSDRIRRLEFAKKANEECWPVRTLQEKVRKYKKRTNPAQKEIGWKSNLRGPVEPRKGKPGAVQVGWLKKYRGSQQVVLDFGFAVYFEESAGRLKKFKAGDWVRRNRRNQWELASTTEDAYYYEAELERVVDGDTLLVQVRLPNGLIRRQYLRLVGFDAPPLKTEAGLRARAKLTKYFSKQSELTFKSRFMDRYDRSLADVWVGDKYLNKELV